MDETSIGKYLIENNYHLTALEFLTEYYEHNGIPIETLSTFFEDSSNFLTFHGKIAPTNDTDSVDAMRIKNDRIAVLEHQVKVLKESLEEAQSSKSNSSSTNTNSSESINLKSPSPTLANTSYPSEAEVLNILISKYLSSNNFRLTSLTFNNERPRQKSDNSAIPEDVDLNSLLRSYLFIQNSPQVVSEIDSLRSEQKRSSMQIAQLKLDLERSNRKIIELTQQLKDAHALQTINSINISAQSLLSHEVPKSSDQSNQTNQINKISSIDQTNDINSLNQVTQADQTPSEDHDSTTINNDNDDLNENVPSSTSNTNLTSSTKISNQFLPIQSPPQFVSDNSQVSQSPPSVEMMQGVYEAVKLLLNELDDSRKSILISSLQMLIELHPSKSIRIECVNMIFSAYSEPNEQQQEAIIKTLAECCSTQEKFEGEVLPIVTQLMGSTIPSISCLVLKVLSHFISFSSVELRYTLLFSIVRQFAETGNAQVKIEVGKTGGQLIRQFGNSEDANEKMNDILDLSKQLIFDSDADVQLSALKNFIPALVQFAAQTSRIGTIVLAYWFKQATNFALTGHSQLATIRFQLASRAILAIFEILGQKFEKLQKIENAENSEENDQDSSDQNSESTENLDSIEISHTKDEKKWVIENIGQLLVKLGPGLFVQIGIKKDCDGMTAGICNILGQEFTTKYIIPVFQNSITKENKEAIDLKKQILSLYLSAVVPEAGETFFLDEYNKYIEISHLDTDGFLITDVHDYIAFSVTLLMDRSHNPQTIDPNSKIIRISNNSKREMVFKLINSLNTSKKSVFRSASITIIHELVPIIEQLEFESKIMPFIDRLAMDIDEEIELQTIACVGEILRFSTITNVVKKIKKLFDDWFKKKSAIKLQCLRTFSSIVNDVDIQFRDSYLIPKLLEIAKDPESADSQDQIFILILAILHSVKELPDNVIKEISIPCVSILSESPVVSQDPLLKELRERYKMDVQKDGIAKFFSKDKDKE